MSFATSDEKLPFPKSCVAHRTFETELPSLSGDHNAKTLLEPSPSSSAFIFILFLYFVFTMAALAMTSSHFGEEGMC